MGFRCARCMRWVVLLVAVIALGQVVQAEGFRNPPPGAAGLGRAGAFIAHIDDPSAISYNPANLARQPGAAVQLALTLAEIDVDYESPLMGKASSDNALQMLPNVYAQWSAGDDRAWGLGITTPFGQSSEWEKEGVLRYAAPYFVDMQLVNVNPTFSAKIAERVYLGAGFDIYVSNLEFKQLADNGPLPGDGLIDLEADGSGLGGNLALSYDVSTGHRLAMTYRTAVQVDYSGDARISGMPIPIPPKDDLDVSIDFPAIWGLAYGWQVSETVRVEADVEWLEYSSNESIQLSALAYNTTVLPRELENDWDDSWTCSVGGDWAFSANWTVYGGYAFLESPSPDDTFSPTLPDSDRHVISLGVAFDSGGHVVSLAYAGSVYDDRSIENNQNPMLNGDYEFESQLLSISYSCEL